MCGRFLSMRFPVFFGGILLLIIGLSAEARICPSSDEESLLKPGYEYSYHFKSEAFGEAVGTTDDRSKIAIDCDVLITHSSECVHNLELQNCHLTAAGGPPGSETAWIDRKSLSELSRFPISFSIINGEVSDVYTHKDDPIYFVNIKRGVLSAFVFKLSYTSIQKDETHTDIHGTCPLSTTPVSIYDGKVKTTKDMLNCHFPSRPDWQFSPWSLFWNMSFIQYVINSTDECDYRIRPNEKIIQSVFCKERHAIMLESSQRTAVAVQTNIYYTMNFVKSSPQPEGVSYPELTRKTSIVYEFEQTEDPKTSPPNFLPVAKKMLSDLVQDSIDEIRLFTISQFTDFVAWIRSSNDLLPLVNSVRRCTFLSEGECTKNIKELGMSYLSDALVQCNSLACFEAVSHLAKNDEFSQAYLNFVFYSWSNIHVSKPAILKSVMNLCKEKESNLCWITLGSMLEKSYIKIYTYKPEEVQELKEIASFLRDLIVQSCSSGDSGTENLVRYLKAVGNIGDKFLALVPDGSDQLMDCAFNDAVPVFARSLAIEAVKKVNPCQNHDTCGEIYQKMLSLLSENTAVTTLRIAAYDLIVQTVHDFDFQEQLANILASDDDIQLKSYIAHSVKNILKDPEMNVHRKGFVKSLKMSLEKKDISLEKLIHDPSARSLTLSDTFFTKIYFPKDLEWLRFEKIFSKVYEQCDALPRHLRKEFWVKAFRTLFPVYQVGGDSEGLEQIMILVQKAIEDMDSEYFDTFHKTLSSLPEMIKQFSGASSLTKNFNFDETIISNIQKLEQVFRSYSPKLKPYFVAYLDLFGSTLAHFSSGDFVKFASELSQVFKVMEKLQNGVTYNATRVIRVIEAYHQVPTMMGLPLNWTTNATLAVSMRSGLKMMMSGGYPDVHSSGFLHPSAALTFLNRMVLDFPTITQIGVQANSSGYSSVQWNLNMDYSKDKKILSIQKPQKSQKLLELFRSNQLIKHDTYNDIPDWDIDRFSSSWCSQDEVSSVFGIQACLDKSYPLVTERLKPWALMSGSCKWLLSVDSIDENIKSYDAEILKLPSLKSNGILLRFSVFGGQGNPETFLYYDRDDTKGDMKIELTAPALPDFTITLSKSKVSESSKQSSYRSVSTIKLRKDYQYQLIYNEDNKFVEREEIVDVNRSAKSKKSSGFTQEQLYSLTTPFNDYRFKKETTKIGEAESMEMKFSHENLKEERKWLHEILPPTMWDSDSKAWVRVQINWKAPSINAVSETRHTVCFVRIPHSTIELDAKSFRMDGRQQILLNLTKTEVATGKLLGFANFTYDMWNSGMGDTDLVGDMKEIRLVNLTIPRKSWAINYQRVREESLQKFELEIKRAAMTSKNSRESNYIGWWNQDLRDEFTLQEHRLKAVADIDIRMISSDELVSKYSTLTEEDIAGLRNRYIKADLKLEYPFPPKQESVTFDGYIIISRLNRLYRFQKNFDMESSYNNLRLTSHTVYRADADDVSLDHKSFFTHLQTQTKAYNIMKYKRNQNSDGCKESSWKHDIQSHVFDLKSRAAYKCHPGSTNLRTLKLDWITNSSYWNMLDMNLNQIIEDVSDEYSYETVNITHAMALINVTADWVGKQRDHKKKVVFNCLNEDCQNAEFFYNSLSNGEISAKLRLPEDSGKELAYRRKLSADNKHLQIKISYNEKKNFDLEDDFEDLEFSGEIVDEHLHIWKVTLNPLTVYRVWSTLTGMKDAAILRLSQAAKDPEHPLNKILEPALKVTLYEYWKEFIRQASAVKNSISSSSLEVIRIMNVFFENAIGVLVNTFTSVLKYSMETFYSLKEKSVIIWFMDYFEVPYFVYFGLRNFDYYIRLFLQLLPLEDGNIRFEFATGKVLELTSFKEWPSFSFENFKPSIFYQIGKSLSKYHLSSPGAQFAMIFGPLHVYTFDGHLYDSADYSSDCLFLLAHDLRQSMFSVLSSEKSIHILFPEMSITINDENEVFINGSTSPSQLPIQAYNRKVTVKRGSAIEVWSPSLKVTCRNEDFLCALELAPWHSGGTFGLLGNADGSLHNEFMMPNGEIATNVLEFIHSYEVSGKSECKNLKITSKSSSPRNYLCIDNLDNLCKQASHIQESFLQACDSDMSDGHGSCYAESGYSALCHFKNLPSVAECNAAAQDSNKVGHKLEVVLIAHEHHSFTVAEKKKSSHKGIERLLTAIDDKFKSNGYSNIQYSLVGYGGKGVSYNPSIHSTERNVWVPLRTLTNNVLKTLAFNGHKTVDNLNAVKYTLDTLGYNSFDSKIFIMLTAEDTQIRDKASIESIQQQLDDNGITLYTISSYPSIEKGKKVFGVRADGLIFPSPKKDGTAFMDYPKGDLAKLTAGTRGSVFLSKFLIANNPASYYGEIAEEIWAKVHKEADSCRECKTVRSGWWFGVKECKIVSC